MLTANDFIGVRAALITELGNDANRAVVLTRIFYRADERWREAIERDGHWWWRVRQHTLAEETGLSTKQVERCLKWLIAEGYLMMAVHHEQGAYDQTRSYRVILDIPESGDDIPESGNVHLPESGNVPLLQTEKTLKLVDGNKTEAEIDQVFGMFWDLYPRHIAKAKARSSFIAALKKVSADAVIQGAAAYRKHVGDGDPQFIAHPATWLNQERWDDDYGPVAGTGRAAMRRL